MKNKNTTATVENKYEHPGRPRYEMVYPRGAEWTFTQLMAVNGVNTIKGTKGYGKGEKCTMLTLRKNLDRALYCLTADGKVASPKKLSAKSFVVPVKGVTADPESESGLGRRATLYRLRSVAAKDHTPKAKSKATTPKASKAVKDTIAQNVEDAKAILAETTPIQITPATAPVIPTAPVETVQNTDTVVPIPDAVHNDFPVDVPAPEVSPVETAPIVNETPATVPVTETAPVVA
jgi:hypothetical protein